MVLLLHHIHTVLVVRREVAAPVVVVVEISTRNSSGISFQFHLLKICAIAESESHTLFAGEIPSGSCDWRNWLWEKYSVTAGIFQSNLARNALQSLIVLII